MEQMGADHVLIRKRDAAQAALDHWSLQDFALGKADCAQMAARHLRMLGKSIRLPPKGSYRSVPGALRAMRKLGFASLAEWIDSAGVERIAPARVVAGDVLQLPAEHPLGGLAIALGNGAAVAWMEDVPGGAITIRPLLFLNAWRVDP